MIVTMWFRANFLIDTPERRIRIEAKRTALALEKYNKVYAVEQH